MDQSALLPVLLLGLVLGFVGAMIVLRVVWHQPLQRANEGMERTLQRVMAENEDIRRRIRILSGRHSREERTRLLAEEGAAAVRSELAELRRLKDLLEVQLVEAHAHNDGLRGKAAELQGHVDGLRSKLADEQKEHTLSVASLAELRNQLNRAQEKLGELTGQNSALQTGLAEVKGQRDQLQSQLTDQARRQALMEAELERGRAQTAEHALLAQANESLQNQMKELKERLIEESHQLKAAQTELREKSKLLGELEAKLGAARAELERLPALTAEREELEEQLATIQAERSSLAEKLTVHEKDNLREIYGIGPTFERRLHAAGIDSYVALAQATPERLREIAKLRPWQAANTVEWIEAAKELVSARTPAERPES